ncbi:GDP-fucose protein O-fucosyltransferase 3-like [Oratosquilla oratoria]|uniref:GDP-fucose protein O-fucosyltransferase 3-like n=1 Tax=Oratosquilla oratoria TaxID=337810 RepID=UPI003F76FA60
MARKCFILVLWILIGVYVIYYFSLGGYLMRLYKRGVSSYSSEGAGDVKVDSLHMPVILWWTPFTGAQWQTRECREGSCIFTENRSYLKKRQTKAVMFYGSDFDPIDMPLPRRARHWWALLHEESPKNQNLFDHEPVLSLFNLTATFKRTSDFPLTLQYLTTLESLTSLKNYVPTSGKNKFLDDLAPVIYVQSDCDTPSERDDYVKELSKFIKIDSYGKCLHNRDLPRHLQDPIEAMDADEFLRLTANYKFTLAFENAVCDDYITEKLWRPLSVGSLPVYLGSPSVKDWLPNPGAAILVQDFDTAESLASFLNRLNTDDDLYERHMLHKTQRTISNTLLKKTMENRPWGVGDLYKDTFIDQFECFVCNQILSRHDGRRSGEFVARLDHYGCPAPTNPLSGRENRESQWVEMWYKAKYEAEVVRDFALKNPRVLSSRRYHEEVINKLQEHFFEIFPPKRAEL